MDRTRLKYLAVLLMVLDHVGAVLPLQGPLWLILRGLGRMSFPIFAWMAAEGLRKSGDRRKYVGRLALFALISEVPFQLFSRNFGSVLLTFLLAALGILTAEKLLERELNLPTALLPVLAAMVLAEFLGTDYGLPGVLLVSVLFFMEDRRKPRLIWTAVWGVLYQLLWQSFPVLLAMLPAGLMTPNLSFILTGFLTGHLPVGLIMALCTAAAALPLSRYNGQPGQREHKWFFYWFYPAHLLVLWLVSVLLRA